MTNLKYDDVGIEENHEPMVNLKDYPFILVPMYFEWKLSNSSELWLRQAVAEKLLKIQKEYLEPLGQKFKIFDPWRSREVQNNIYQKYWNEMVQQHPDWDEEKMRDEVGKFVTRADKQERVPPHATGGSVDLTIANDEGKELDFGTVFDHFGPEAATDYYNINDINNIVRDNRNFLQKIMSKEKFGNDIDEWWHFDFGNQKWALLMGHYKAFYGEVSDPVEFNLNTDKEARYAIS